MDDREQIVANLRARIAALRKRLDLGIESFEDMPAPSINNSVTEPQRPKVEPDWDAIAKLTAKNDEREAKSAELAAMKEKLMGNK